MLIGNSAKKPSLTTIRRIKSTLREALNLGEDSVVTVTQLACLETDCAPLETVFGLLQPGTTQLQYKVHKATEDIHADDLMQVCEAWGYDIKRTMIEPLFQET